ncbi:MAG: peptide-methionine (S)-S-oxide reductase [Arthrospira sp. PLM2.Bin9]|nr:MAG: peptide-methionine (S)-S-oxide reductase [Arthrospira sp. PLM2.Bin9]
MIETATFAAGCFWGVAAKFSQINGVIETATGYMGGHFPHPSYLDVAARITGHAEVVQLQYNPDLVSYQQLLEVFWQIHDPTSLNRQGPDRGEQYRSAIFYHSSQQEQIARKSKHQLQISGTYPRPIVTEIKPASEFYPGSGGP